MNQGTEAGKGSEQGARDAFERWAFSVGWRNFTRDEHSGAYVVEGGLQLRWIGWLACALASPAASEAPPEPWRTEAVKWLRRKEGDGNQGWGNPGHWASVFAEQLEAEQESAPFGSEPWDDVRNKFGDKLTPLGKDIVRGLASLAASGAPAEAGSAPTNDHSGPPYTLDGMDPVLRDLIVCAVHGAMATREQPPAGHWLNSSWQLGYAMRQEGEPVAWVNGDDLDNLLNDREATIAGKPDGWRRTALYRLAAKAEAGSAPLAELPGMWHESDLSGGATDCAPTARRTAPGSAPLVLPEPLTEEQINAAIRAADGKDWRRWYDFEDVHAIVEKAWAMYATPLSPKQESPEDYWADQRLSAYAHPSGLAPAPSSSPTPSSTAPAALPSAEGPYSPEDSRSFQAARTRRPE